MRIKPKDAPKVENYIYKSVTYFWRYTVGLIALAVIGPNYRYQLQVLWLEKRVHSKKLSGLLPPAAGSLLPFFG